MARVHIFSDEAGDFTFRHGAGISEYFIIATVTLDTCSIGDKLRELQRELAWSGQVLENFHAVDDRPNVRRYVYDLIAKSSVRIDATALHKPKAQPHLVQDHVHFYKMANYLHYKYVIPRVASSTDDLMVVASSLQIKRKKHAVATAVGDVVRQVSPTRKFVTAFFRNDTDPCLQIADYAAWAIQRKLERGDDSYYKLVEHNVKSVFEPWAIGKTIYY
jgi:hypothetical protein